ncbi:MAG TPA: hypothetical protein VMZ69_11710 [Saprospiraceae bacterium]|nr:hypothetical protein [Saprospiraceae bacterium]
MKKIFYIILALFIISCKDERNEFPKSYTFDRIEQTDEGLYLVEDADQLSSLLVTSGTYGAYRDTFKSDMRELIEIAFNVIEIELLNEDSLFFHYAIDNTEYDTTLAYTNIDGEIVIDSLTGTLLHYEKNDDEFAVCGVTTFALEGPNSTDPSIDYGKFLATWCTNDLSNQDYAYRLLNEFEFGAQDTIGVLLTRYLYK